MRILHEALHAILTEDELRHTSVAPIMTKAGYTHLGSGAEADVWSKDAGTVTKIVVSQETFTGKQRKGSLPLFVEYIAANRNNTHLPKLIPSDGHLLRKITVDSKAYYQLNIEKLQPLSPDGKKLVQAITVGGDWRKRASFGPTWFENIRLKFKGTAKQLSPEIAKQLPEFMKTVRGLYLYCAKKGARWDLASSNVMQRADGTLVVTDPWL